MIFSRWHPLRAVGGALLFGGAISLQLQMQARGVPISPFLLDMLPYVLSLAVLAGWGGAHRHAAPGSLGRVFQGKPVTQAKDPCQAMSRRHESASCASRLRRRRCVAPGGRRRRGRASPKLKVGVVHLGSITDGGYNQAHAEGIAVDEAEPARVEVIQVENVPEGADAERVMENMIKRGAS